MQSLNRHVVQQRIAYVVDTAVGAQADSRGLKKHLAALRRAVGLRDPGTKGTEAFKARFGARR